MERGAESEVLDGDGWLPPDVEQATKSTACDLDIGVFELVREVGIDGVEDLDRLGRAGRERSDSLVYRSIALSFGPPIPAGEVDVAVALGDRAVRLGLLPASGCTGGSRLARGVWSPARLESRGGLSCADRNARSCCQA